MKSSQLKRSQKTRAEEGSRHLARAMPSQTQSPVLERMVRPVRVPDSVSSTAAWDLSTNGGLHWVLSDFRLLVLAFNFSLISVVIHSALLGS